MANKVTQYKPQSKTENRATRRVTAVGAVADNAQQKRKTITTTTN